MFIAPAAFNQILGPGSVEISGVLTPGPKLNSSLSPGGWVARCGGEVLID